MKKEKDIKILKKFILKKTTNEGYPCKIEVTVFKVKLKKVVGIKRLYLTKEPNPYKKVIKKFKDYFLCIEISAYNLDTFYEIVDLIKGYKRK